MMDTEFTTLQYDNRHLVIRNAPSKNPLVIAECYLPEIAATICKLLTDAVKDESDARKLRNNLETAEKR